MANLNTYVAARCEESATGQDSMPEDNAACTAVTDRDDASACEAVVGSVDPTVAVCTYTAAVPATQCQFTPLDEASCPAGCTYSAPLDAENVTTVTLEEVTEIDTYRCLCTAGYANGLCECERASAFVLLCS